jgi:hypothetical protein
VADGSSGSDSQFHQGGVQTRLLLASCGFPELKPRKLELFVQVLPIFKGIFPGCVEGGHVLCTAVLHVFNEGVEMVNQTHQAWHVG